MLYRNTAVICYAFVLGKIQTAHIQAVLSAVQTD